MVRVNHFIIRRALFFFFFAFCNVTPDKSDKILRAVRSCKRDSKYPYTDLKFVLQIKYKPYHYSRTTPENELHLIAMKSNECWTDVARMYKKYYFFNQLIHFFRDPREDMLPCAHCMVCVGYMEQLLCWKVTEGCFFFKKERKKLHWNI